MAAAPGALSPYSKPAPESEEGGGVHLKLMIATSLHGGLWRRRGVCMARSGVQVLCFGMSHAVPCAWQVSGVWDASWAVVLCSGMCSSHQACMRRPGASGIQKFVYQKWLIRIFPFVNCHVPHCQTQVRGEGGSRGGVP